MLHEKIENPNSVRADSENCYVCTALLTHLEQTAEECRAEGCDEAESLERARKTFGSLLELAAELVSGNTRRMKLRALARLALQALVVPAAIALALWLGYGGLVRLQRIPRRALEYLTRYNVEFTQAAYANAAYRFSMLPLYPNGNISSEDGLSQYYHALHSLLNAHPNDRRYHAYVISASFSQMQEDSMQDYETALQQGMQLDPDNALYHYLQWQISGGPYDQKQFALLMHEIRLGLNKPYLKDYKDEVISDRLAELPPAMDCADYYEQTLLVKNELYFHYEIYRQIARSIPIYAEILIKDGRTDEALELLRQWKRLPSQIMQDSHGMLGVMVANECARELGTQTAAIYQYLGRDELAAQTRQELALLTAPVNRYMAKKSLAVNDLMKRTNFVAGSAGWIDSRLRSRVIVDADDRAALIPQRVMGYKIMEEFALSLLLVVLALCIIGLWITQDVFLYRLRAARAVPILLLPGWRQVARILLVGVFLPLAAYAGYSLLPIAGRGVGVEHNLPRFIIEMLLLGGLLIALPWLLTVLIIRRRCGQLDVPVPPIKAGWALRRDPRYRLYFGTVARSLVPIYALVLLAVVLVCRPALHYQERAAYQQDRLFFVHHGETMPRLEAQTATRLRSEVLQMAEKLEREAK